MERKEDAAAHREAIRQAMKDSKIHIVHKETYSSDDNYQAIYGADDLAALVYDSIHYYQQIAGEAAEKANRTLDEAKQIVVNQYADENAQLQRRLHLSYGEFNSEKELNAYHEFCKLHESCRAAKKINGGRYPYIIPTGTGVGIHYDVICPICGKQQDITDYDTW